MNKVCPSFGPEIFLELTLQFFLKLSMVLGAHVMLCMLEPENMRKWEKFLRYGL